MTIGENKLNEIKESIIKSDRTRFGIEDLNNIIRRFGIAENWQIKAVVKYLEACNVIKLNGRLWVKETNKVI